MVVADLLPQQGADKASKVEWLELRVVLIITGVEVRLSKVMERGVR
jgi:hypothetical protein